MVRNPGGYSTLYTNGNPYDGAGGGGGGADSRTSTGDRKNGGNGTPGFVVIFFLRKEIKWQLKF